MAGYTIKGTAQENCHTYKYDRKGNMGMKNDEKPSNGCSVLLLYVVSAFIIVAGFAACMAHLVA